MQDGCWARSRLHGFCPWWSAFCSTRHPCLIAAANGNLGTNNVHSCCIQVQPANWCQEPSTSGRTYPEECHDVLSSENSVCSNFNRFLRRRRGARHGIDAWTFLFAEYRGGCIANRGSWPSPTLQASWAAIWPRLSPTPPRNQHLYSPAAGLCCAPGLCGATSLPLTT